MTERVRLFNTFYWKMFPFCHTYLIRINLYNGKSSHFRVPFLSSPDFLTAHNHVIFYHPPLGGIQDTVNLISSRGELSATGSYTRLFKVTFVTGAGLIRPVIQQKIWNIWVCTSVVQQSLVHCVSKSPNRIQPVYWTTKNT